MTWEKSWELDNSFWEVNYTLVKVFCSDPVCVAEASVIPTSANFLNGGTR